MELAQLFWDVDDFCKDFEIFFNSQALPPKQQKRNRKFKLSLSEIVTIIIYFHSSSYRNFKDYYLKHVSKYLQPEFPNLVSYNRFVELMPSALIPLICYLNTRQGTVTGISFIDAPKIPVCHNARASRNKVFEGLAKWGKSSRGWFWGFNLHLIINEKGELLSFKVTPGNVDERVPVPDLVQEIVGKMFGDKGYISNDLFKKLFNQGLQLITPIKKNMKNRLMPWQDKILLRKRSLIEPVTDQLKNISQIVHSRHRSIKNFMVNIIAGLVAYTYQEKKPSLNLTDDELALLPAPLSLSEI